MSVFTLYSSIEAKPRSFDNLVDPLKHASHIARANGLNALHKLERDGELFLAVDKLRYWVNQIESRQRKHDRPFDLEASFDVVVNAVIQEIEKENA